MRGGKAKALVTGFKMSGCNRCPRRPTNTAETSEFHIAHIDATAKQVGREYSVAYWADHGGTPDQIIEELRISECLCSECHAKDSGLAQAQRRRAAIARRLEEWDQHRPASHHQDWLRETGRNWGLDLGIR